MSEAAIEVPSRQEMFNRAWNGLKSQGWQTCTFQSGGGCSYDGPHGRKCAWGWVDPEGTRNRPDLALSLRYDSKGQLNGTVGTLRDVKIGLAGHLSSEDVPFAELLQRAHDGATITGYPAYLGGHYVVDATMENMMRKVAEVYGLTIPE